MTIARWSCGGAGRGEAGGARRKRVEGLGVNREAGPSRRCGAVDSRWQMEASMSCAH